MQGFPDKSAQGRRGASAETSQPARATIDPAPPLPLPCSLSEILGALSSRPGVSWDRGFGGNVASRQWLGRLLGALGGKRAPAREKGKEGDRGREAREGFAR